MGRVTIIAIITYCLVGMIHSTRLWDGLCGRTMIDGHKALLLSRATDSSGLALGRDELENIVGRMQADPADPKDIPGLAPWQFVVFSGKLQVMGTGMMIRVHPEIEESDMAITTPDVCKAYADRSKCRFYARFGHADSPDQEVVGCWTYTDYDQWEPTRNNEQSGYEDNRGPHDYWLGRVSRRNLTSNFGLLRLKHSVPIGTRSPIGAVCLTSEHTDARSGTIGTMIALGQNGDAIINSLPRHLVRLDVKIVNMDICSRYWSVYQTDGRRLQLNLDRNEWLCVQPLGSTDAWQILHTGQVDLPLTFTTPDGRSIMLGMSARFFSKRFSYRPFPVMRLSKYVVRSPPYDTSAYAWFEGTILAYTRVGRSDGGSSSSSSLATRMARMDLHN